MDDSVQMIIVSFDCSYSFLLLF